MRKSHLVLLVLALVSLTAFAPAQSCSTLAVTGSGMPGTDLTFDLTGAAAEAPALVVIGENTGSTSIRFGRFGTLDLGLDFPFVPGLLGRTDQNGDVSRTVTLPMNLMPRNLNAQGFTVELTLPPNFGLDFCTSNVVAFTIG